MRFKIREMQAEGKLSQALTVLPTTHDTHNEFAEEFLPVFMSSR
jgi:hypothetical protein